MAAASIILDTRRADKNKLYPLKIRITHKNKNVSISTGKSIPSGAWVFGKNGMEIDKKYPNAKLINLDLSEFMVKVNKAIQDLEESNKINGITAVQIKDYILKRSGNTGEQVTFISYFRDFAGKRNAKGTQEIYLNTLKKVINWSNDYLMFEDITVSWMDEFNAHLKQKGNAINTIAIDERNIRAVIKSAIKKRITDIKNPFDDYDIKSRKESKTMPLTVEQMKAIRDFQTNSEALSYARDAFMASFYLIGINVSDLYELEKSERARYYRNKTGAFADIELAPEVISLTERYPDDERMFNFHKRYSDRESFKSRVNKHLKQIGKTIGVPKLIMYHARHTWATWAGILGIEDKVIAKALTHNWNNTTGIYSRFDFRRVNEANRDVLDLLVDVNKDFNYLVQLSASIMLSVDEIDILLDAAENTQDADKYISKIVNLKINTDKGAEFSMSDLSIAAKSISTDQSENVLNLYQKLNKIMVKLSTKQEEVVRQLSKFNNITA